MERGTELAEQNEKPQEKSGTRPQYESMAMPDYSEFAGPVPKRLSGAKRSVKSIAIMIAKAILVGVIVLAFIMLMGLLISFLKRM